MDGPSEAAKLQPHHMAMAFNTVTGDECYEWIKKKADQKAKKDAETADKRLKKEQQLVVRATARRALVAQLQAGAPVFNKLSLLELKNVAEALNHTIICEAGKTYVKVETLREHLARKFASELTPREGHCPWISCDDCRKWRRQKISQPLAETQSFVCSDNSDPGRQSCDAPEETLDEIEVDMPSSTPDSPGRPESGPY